jgi:DNA-binding transcriptional MerR regulator
MSATTMMMRVMMETRADLASEKPSGAQSKVDGQAAASSGQKIKIPDRLYFKIGDVADLLGVKPYVLRYWESEFPMISPQKSNSGQRVYRRSDVETVVMIKTLLYDERYSIEGARKRIKELRKGGELKSFKKEAASPNRDEVVVEGLRRAKQLAKEMQKLSLTPIDKLFSL